MSERKPDYLEEEYERLAERLTTATDEEKMRIMNLMERIRKLKMAQLNEEQKKDEIERKKSEGLLDDERKVCELEKANQLNAIEIEQKKIELEKAKADLEKKDVPWESIIRCGTIVMLAVMGLSAEAGGHILPKFAGLLALNKMV